MIRVLIVDDHPAMRAGVKQAISEARDIEVVGELSNGAELWAYLARSLPDVLLLDLLMPGFDPMQEIPRIRKLYPDVQILIVTFYDTGEFVLPLVKMGVAGYLLKEEEMSTYVQAIRDVGEGGVFYSKRILPLAVGGGIDTPALTRREFEVMKLVAQGKTSEQIAAELVVVRRTVDFHVENVMRKLGVDNRTAAAAKASELNLISTWRKP
jgi:DNA-binding NarL/FixJ family response regulator